MVTYLVLFKDFNVFIWTKLLFSHYFSNGNKLCIPTSDGSVVSFQKTAVAVLASVVVFLKTAVAVLMRLY